MVSLKSTFLRFYFYELSSLCVRAKERFLYCCAATAPTLAGILHTYVFMLEFCHARYIILLIAQDEFFGEFCVHKIRQG